MDWNVTDVSLPDAAPEDSSPVPRGRPTQALDDRLCVRLATGPRRGGCLYVPGPGDVAGTYRHWAAGRNDPSIPALAYSAQVYEVATAAGCNLTVMTEQPPGNVPTEGPVRFRHMPHPGGSGWRYHLREIRYALALVRAARAEGARTILIQRMLTHFWPLLAARLVGIRIICSLHNTLWPMHRAPSRRERLVGWLNAVFFRRCAAVVGVSEAICDQVRKLAGRGRAAVAVQVPQYDARAIQARQMPERLRQLQYLGRIEENKGVFLLLDAFARAAGDHPDLMLRFTGDGSALEALRAAAAALPPEIARRVEIPGPCDGAGVRAVLAATDLLVCPTTSRFAEGLAKTPVEAALAGVPSLISDVVPVASLLGRAAMIVPADDVEALAGAMEELARDPTRLWAMARATADSRGLFTDRRLSLASRLAQAFATLPQAAPKELTAVNLLPEPTLDPR